LAILLILVQNVVGSEVMAEPVCGKFKREMSGDFFHDKTYGIPGQRYTIAVDKKVLSAMVQ
jgi:hypothetical protein